MGAGGVSANPPVPKEIRPVSQQLPRAVCVCAGSEWPPGPPGPPVTATQGHPSCTGVRDTHPPRTAQLSLLSAQGPQDPHPRAAPSLLKGRGPGRCKKGREQRDSHNLGRNGTPHSGYHPPITHWTPRSRRGAGERCGREGWGCHIFPTAGGRSEPLAAVLLASSAA